MSSLMPIAANVYNEKIAHLEEEQDGDDTSIMKINHAHPSLEEVIEKISEYSLVQISAYIANIKLELYFVEKSMSSKKIDVSVSKGQVEGSVGDYSSPGAILAKFHDEKILEILEGRFQILKDDLVRHSI